MLKKKYSPSCSRKRFICVFSGFDSDGVLSDDAISSDRDDFEMEITETQPLGLFSPGVFNSTEFGLAEKLGVLDLDRPDLLFDAPVQKETLQLLQDTVEGRLLSPEEASLFCSPLYQHALSVFGVSFSELKDFLENKFVFQERQKLKFKLRQLTSDIKEIDDTGRIDLLFSSPERSSQAKEYISQLVQSIQSLANLQIRGIFRQFKI